MKSIILFIILGSAYSQDERYFRELISGDLIHKKGKEKKNYKWSANSPFYEIDLGNTQYPESIVIEKRDGEDWLHIHDHKKSRIFSFHFDVNGKNSRIYRVLRKKISKSTVLLLIYYYEGNTDYRYFNGAIRLYFLTVDNRDLSTIAVFKGPVYWEEQETVGEKYFQKKYQVNFLDFNNDGILELAVGGKFLINVYSYSLGGKWRGV